MIIFFSKYLAKVEKKVKEIFFGIWLSSLSCSYTFLVLYNQIIQMLVPCTIRQTGRNKKQITLDKVLNGSLVYSWSFM